jgi:hypothetical protein
MNSDYSLGKLSEMQFCVDAAKRGLNVSVPSHDHSGYDLIAEGSSSKLYKVQVKATRAKSIQNDRTPCYKIQISRGSKSKRRYDKNEVDFFAVYIYELNNWYIVPFNACTSISIRLYPSKPNHKFSKFLEAWHLIK